MKKRTIFYFALILLLLGGCSKEIIETIDDDAPMNKDGSIAFRTESVLTKGTPHDDLKKYNKVQLRVFKHDKAYADGNILYRKTELIKGGSDADTSWDYTPRMFWPEGKGLSFLAYSIETAIPYAKASGDEGVFIKENSTTNVPTIEYRVPVQVKDQPDLLVTAQIDQPEARNVMLNMKHALACVSFCATGPTDMKVKQLQMKNVYTKGSFQLDDPDIQWKLDPNSKNLIVIEPGMNDENLQENPTDGNYLMTQDGYLMMLPQALTDATIEVTYWKGTPGTEKKITYILPTNIVWEAGQKYIYKFGEDTEEIVVYYEMYADGSLGVHSNDYRHTNLTPKLDETKEITEAGYGVLTKSRFVSSNTPTIKLGTATAISSKKIEGVSGGYNLYVVNQTGIVGTSTFVLPTEITPVSLYFDGNNVESYKIIPHVAKGATLFGLSEYSIRTPQQMKNLSALTTSDPFYILGTSGKVFRQERDLDFSKTTIGGGTLNGSVVDDQFGGTYEGKYNGVAKSISNVTINAPGTDNVGLFSVVASAINDITLTSSSITGGNNVGGIVGTNYGMNGAINRPRVIGTNSSTGKVIIKGSGTVGGIAGINNAAITGNTAIVAMTEVTVAEVSGWVDIIGTGDFVGGIVGNNNSGTIHTVLVNGVNEVNSTDAKINIKGAQNVGGIAGINWRTINGNMTGVGANVKNMPDLAGIVEITGTNWIGGITGMNAGGATINSANIRLGRVTPMKITGTGVHVGGIAGQNNGTLGVENSKTFISTRGNIEISGAGNVGGIVGTNAQGAHLRNCFVYNFFTQGAGKKYYAPRIICSGDNAGGIAGSNAASIYNCSVFTAERNTQLTITANANGGGIAGTNDSNGKTELCSVVGKVEITLPVPPDPIPWLSSINAGGICGINKGGTTISQCWIGSSDGKNIIKNAKTNLGLVTTPPDEPGVMETYGIPVIKGKKYIGGVVGMNDGGIIENIELADNVIIGIADMNPNVNTGSDWVGGIAGGNTPSYMGTNNIIRNCKVTNLAGKTIVIQGASNLGGIVGLNNGVVDGCEVSGIAGNPLTITGLGTIGGIVGQVGGHRLINTTEEGNDYTLIANCKVNGYVTLSGNTGGWGLALQVGGVVGLLGPSTGGRNNLSGCVVKGTAANSIIVTSGGSAGGVVGKNSGNILSCDVYNTKITSVNTLAGGITGHSFCNSAYPATAPNYHADINDCRVYSATISAPTWGAWIGVLDTGTLTGAVTIGRTNQNYVFATPAIGRTTSLGTVTTNCSVQTPPARP